MCTILLEIGMVIMGIVALVKGKISLTANRVVYGIPARVIGVLLMLPLPLVFGGSFVLGFVLVSQGKPIESVRVPAMILEISILVITGIAVVVIGIATAGKPPRKKKRLPRDEPDENTFDNTAV